MSNPTMRLLPAIAWHVSHLMGLQHDGRGLPKQGSPASLVLAGMKLVLAGLVISQLMPEMSLASGFMKSLLSLCALYACASATQRHYAFSGYLLVWSAVDVGLLGLSLVVDDIPRAFITTCYAWGLLAFIVLLYRAGSHNDKNTS